MSKHTPGPWTIRNGRLCSGNIPVAKVLRSYDFGNHRTPIENHEANAERIVACVNAMEGIEDPEHFRRKGGQMSKAEKLLELLWASQGICIDDDESEVERLATKICSGFGWDWPEIWDLSYLEYPTELAELKGFSLEEARDHLFRMAQSDEAIQAGWSAEHRNEMYKLVKEGIDKKERV